MKKRSIPKIKKNISTKIKPQNTDRPGDSISGVPRIWGGKTAPTITVNGITGWDDNKKKNK